MILVETIANTARVGMSRCSRKKELSQLQDVYIGTMRRVRYGMRSAEDAGAVKQCLRGSGAQT